MLLVPKLKRPPGGQRQGANQDRLDADRKDFTSKQIGHSGLLKSFGFGMVPLLGFRHSPPDPEHQQGRKNAYQKDPAWILAGHQISSNARQQDTDIDPTLQNGGNPGSPAFRPGL